MGDRSAGINESSLSGFDELLLSKGGLGFLTRPYRNLLGVTLPGRGETVCRGLCGQCESCQ